MRAIRVHDFVCVRDGHRLPRMDPPEVKWCLVGSRLFSYRFERRSLSQKIRLEFDGGGAGTTHSISSDALNSRQLGTVPSASVQACRKLTFAPSVPMFALDDLVVQFRLSWNRRGSEWPALAIWSVVFQMDSDSQR